MLEALHVVLPAQREGERAIGPGGDRVEQAGLEGSKWCMGGNGGAQPPAWEACHLRLEHPQLAGLMGAGGITLP